MSLPQAISYAKKMHTGHKRKSGEPYITHSLAVMEILKEHNFSGKILMGAVLHDVCADSATTNLYIKKQFGDRIGFVIDALTKNQKPKRNSLTQTQYKKIKHETGQYDTFEKYLDFRFHIYISRFYLGVVADPWVMLIKMADQIHNLRTMHFLPPELVKRKVFEIETFFLPIYQKSRSLLKLAYLYRYEDLLKLLYKELSIVKKKYNIH